MDAIGLNCRIWKAREDKAPRSQLGGASSFFGRNFLKTKIKNVMY